MALLQPFDTVSERYDLGLLPQQQGTEVQKKRRQLELLQSMLDRMTGGIVPRNEGGAQTTSGQAATRAGTERFINNMLGLPEFALDAGANIGNPMGFLNSLKKDTLPMPTGADVLTGIDAAGEAAAAVTSGDFSQFSPDIGEASRMRSEVMAQQQPTASALGSVAGDVATLATLRAPVAKIRGLGAANAAERQALLRAEIEAAKQSGIITNPMMADTVPAMLQRMTVQSRGFGNLMEKTGRIAETGIEGAVLGILTDKDPLETAAYSAGTQAAGNVVLGIMPGGSLAKVGLAAVAATTLFQVANSVLPGGQDRILPAVEAGFNKVALALAAGVLTGAAGMGRVSSKALPQIADYMTALPRAAVVQRLSVDPNYFGPTAGRRLERAFRNPNISISGVIEDLMENKAFREKYEALEKSN
jgi:hypothetical protein